MSIIGNGAPFYYDHINAAVSQVSPSTVHVKNTGMQRFFTRYLLQKAMSVFEWQMPEEWAKNYFLYTLYCWGYISVINTDKFGIIPQGCSLKGYNVMYQPTHAVIANPLLTGIMEPQIGTECALIQLQPDYGSIMDLVSYYADMMALCAESAAANTLNSKLSYVFRAGNKAAAEAFKKMFDQIASGEPAVFIDKSLLNDDGSVAWDSFSADLSSNYIAGDILDDMKKWENEFCTRIGIPNSNTEKKERMIVDEVNANNFDTRSNCHMWLESLQKGCRTASNMFGINLSVDWRKELQSTEVVE